MNAPNRKPLRQMAAGEILDLLVDKCADDSIAELVVIADDDELDTHYAAMMARAVALRDAAPTPIPVEVDDER